MPTRYMPRPDADFAVFADQYVAAVEKWWGEQGLDANALKPLKEALDAWDAAYPRHTAAQSAAEAARQSKDQARAALERQVRPIANFIQAYPATTNADRASIGITVRASPRDRTPAPGSRPLVIVEVAGRLTHQLRLSDESTPTRRARPRGAERAELFVAFTPAGAPAPAETDAYRYVQSVSDGSTVLSFESPRGGMQAHYLARWVNRTGASGPWSETSSATVAA